MKILNVSILYAILLTLSTVHALAIEVQVNTVEENETKYFLQKRYVNLKDTQSVTISCHDGDELITGGCISPGWVPVTSTGPDPFNPFTSWTCTFAPIVELKNQIQINPYQGAKRVEVYLTASALCKKAQSGLANR